MQVTKLEAVLFCSAMLLCAVRPLLIPVGQMSATHGSVHKQNWAFERWNLAKNPLRQLPLTSLEQSFAAGFPGYIGRFSDGQTVWVIRHIARPTRMLHSAIDCYRGLGYRVSTPHVVQQGNEARWRCFNAEGKQKLQVCERIFDEAQGNWTDVSAWYWHAQFESGSHEWWAITRVTQQVAS